MANKALYTAKTAEKDEFYTQLEDIENGRMSLTLSTLEINANGWEFIIANF